MNNRTINSLKFIATAMLALSMTACGDSSKKRMLTEFNNRIDLTLLPAFHNVGYGRDSHPSYYVNDKGEEVIPNSELISTDYEAKYPHVNISIFDSNKIAIVGNKRLIDLTGKTSYESDGKLYGLMGEKYRQYLSPSSGMENRYIEIAGNFGAFNEEHRLINAKGEVITDLEGKSISGLESKYIATKRPLYYDEHIYRLKDGEQVFPDYEGNTDELKLYTSDDAFAFSTYYPELILVKDRDSKVGLYDLENHQFLIEPGDADDYYNFSPVDINRCIIVCKDRKFGLIDAEGNELIEPQFSEMETDGEWYQVTLDGQRGWCDKNGNFTIEPQFKAGYEYSNSTRFLWDDWAYVPSESGFIDRKGNIVLELPRRLIPVMPFINNKALAKFDNTNPTGFVWIDREGNEISQRFFFDGEEVLSYILQKI